MADPLHKLVRGHALHADRTRAFCKLLEQAANIDHWRWGETLTKFLAAAACAVTGPTIPPASEAWHKNEERYFDAIKVRDPARPVATLFAEMLSELTLALEAYPGDFLGPIFSEVAANAGAGQFFTPWEVSKLMAMVSISDAPRLLAEEQVRGGRFITLMEPACGTGGMPLAANAVLRDLGVCPTTQAHWTCVDIDRRCCDATLIQLSLTGASADVIHGNPLTMEQWGSARTVAAFMFPKRRALKVDAPPPAPDVLADPGRLRAQFELPF